MNRSAGEVENLGIRAPFCDIERGNFSAPAGSRAGCPMEKALCIRLPFARKLSTGFWRAAARHHLFDSLDPAKTAFVVIDMQNMFCAPGSPAEVPASRGICEPINRLASELRELGGVVIWVTSATVSHNGKSDWEHFICNFVAEDVQQKTIEALRPNGPGEQIWSDLEVKDGDLHVRKNRYSVLTPGSSMLQTMLSSMGIRNVADRRDQDQYLL